MGGGEGVLSSCVGLDPEGLQGGSKAGVATGVAAAGVSGGWWATSTSGLQYCLSETLAGGGVVGVAVPSASCAPAGAAVDGDDGDVEGGTALRRPGSLLWVFCNPGRVLFLSHVDGSSSNAVGAEMAHYRAL